MLCLVEQVTAICRSYSDTWSTRFVSFFFFSFFSLERGEIRGRNTIFGQKTAPASRTRGLLKIKVRKIDCAPQKALGVLSSLTAREHPTAGFQGKSLPDQKERSGKQNRALQSPLIPLPMPENLPQSIF